MKLQDLISHSLYGNTMLEWGLSVGILLTSQVLVVRARGFFLRWARRRESELGSRVYGSLASFIEGLSVVFLWGLSLYCATYALSLPASWRRAGDNLLVVVLCYQAAICGSHIAAACVRHAFLGQEGEGTRAASVDLLVSLAQGAIWLIAGLTILSQFGVNVLTLIAGLGIGGVAVALAVQKVLSDVLASLSIVLDRPFDVGDFVIKGDIQGTVEKVGLRSTRIRSLTGEQVVVPNNDLLQGTIRNFKRMPERRVVFSLSVTYSTPLEQLQKISSLVRAVIESHSLVRFDRGHFAKFGDSGLIFEFAYFVLTAEYNTYMDLQERINLSIKEIFEREGVDFAYPTQTVIIDRQSRGGSRRVGEAAP